MKLTEQTDDLNNQLTANDGPVGTNRITIYTIGHSTRKTSDFIRVLQAHGVRLLADVRTIPKSRHNPQFNQESIASALQEAGVDYIHLSELGGLRRPMKDSRNNAWRNSSFRGYADYMQTADFRSGFERLVGLAKREQVAAMCAEGNPFRCHRLLLADALTASGLRVLHISSAKSSSLHKLTPFAIVNGTTILYPKL